MGKFYLLNAFSLNMLEIERGWYHFYIEPLTPEETFRYYKQAKLAGKEIISAIGHESTAKLVSALLDDEIPANRIEIKMRAGDEALIFMLSFRPEEGKVYKLQELMELFAEGKMRIIYLYISDVFY